MSATSSQRMPLGETDDAHRIGDAECDEGWCGMELGYPHPCDEPECGGLVHASFGDESDDGYWLYTRCDACGESD